MGEVNSDEIQKDDIEGADSKTADEIKDTTDSGKSDTTDTKGTDSEKKSDDATDDIDIDEEPKTRTKSKIDYILQRKTAKLKKLEGQNQNKGGGESEDEEELDDSDTSDEDEVVDPKDQELIGKEVQKHLRPLIEKQEMDELKSEVSSFITANPDFKQFEAKILKFASHESRKHLPLQAIAYEVAGPYLMKIGAQRAKQADEDAKSNESGGGGSKGGESIKEDVLTMSPERFKEYQREVLSRNRN